MGRFTESIIGQCESYNTVQSNCLINVISAGSDEGFLEFYDLKSNKLLCRHNEQHPITYHAYDSSGLQLMCGKANGKVS